MTKVIRLPLSPWGGFTTVYSGMLFGEQDTVISLCITSQGFHREVGSMLHLEQSETFWWCSGEISCSLVIVNLMGQYHHQPKCKWAKFLISSAWNDSMLVYDPQVKTCCNSGWLQFMFLESPQTRDKALLVSSWGQWLADCVCWLS